MLVYMQSARDSLVTEAPLQESARLADSGLGAHKASLASVGVGVCVCSCYSSYSSLPRLRQRSEANPRPLHSLSACSATAPPMSSGSDGGGPQSEHSSWLSPIGFVCLVPLGGRGTSDAPARLVNRPTGESQDLTQALLARFIAGALEGASWSLFLFGQRLCVAYAEQVVAPVDDILKVRTSVSKSGRWSFHNEGSGARLFCRSEWDRSLQYVTLHCPGPHVFKAWRVAQYVRGAQHWFCLSDIWSYEPIFSSKLGKGMCDLFRNLSSVAQTDGLDEALLMKRTVTGQAGDDSARFLEGHSLVDRLCALVGSARLRQAPGQGGDEGAWVAVQRLARASVRARVR